VKIEIMNFEQRQGKKYYLEKSQREFQILVEGERKKRKKK
tara:strand:- start:70 stop:189 length:120 start_codon:yes stop_codon:yes gene_type:complete